MDISVDKIDVGCTLIDGNFYFCPTIFSTMNLQDILYPIADGLLWFFRNLFEPSTHWFNWVCIAVGFAGMFLWLRMQKNYNRKAKENSGIA